MTHRPFDERNGIRGRSCSCDRPITSITDLTPSNPRGTGPWRPCPARRRGCIIALLLWCCCLILCSLQGHLRPAKCPYGAFFDRDSVMQIADVSYSTKSSPHPGIKHQVPDIRFRSVENLRSWKKSLDSRSHPVHLLPPCCHGGGCGRRWLGSSAFWDLEFGCGQWRVVVYLNIPGVSHLVPRLLIHPKVALHVPHRPSMPAAFDLVRSSPLLEDLALTDRDESPGNGDDPHVSQTAVPSTLPRSLDHSTSTYSER